MNRNNLFTQRAERWALGVLFAVTLLTVAGFWNFALHPERIPDTPGAARFYALSFGLLGQLHILLAAGTLMGVLWGRTRLRWVPALAAVYALSWAAEHVGTGWGIPFGGYVYGELLGPKLGGRVPALIPLSWFLMALPSWVLASKAFPGPGSWLPRMTLGTGWMVTWDLALDPAMSFLTPYWRWLESGPYYGMPLVNLFGWGLTAFVLMGALEVLSERGGFRDLPARWMVGYYLTILLLPLGMAAAGGLWPAVLVTLAAVGALLRFGSAGSIAPGPARDEPDAAPARPSHDPVWTS